MSSRPVQTSSGKRKDTCSKPCAWGRQSCSLFQTQEPLEHRCPQELSTLSPTSSGQVGQCHCHGHATARLCPTPALGPKDARTGEWLLAWAFPAFGCLLASPVSAAPRGPAQRRWSNLSSGRGSWLRPPTGLPMYLLFLARGATTERSRLLPTASAWEQGTRRGAQAQIIAVLCCSPTDQPSWNSQGQAALTY